MKKWFAFAICISLFQFLSAQENSSSNNLFLGGSINFLIQNNTFPLSSLSINSGVGGIYSNNTDDTRNITFSISPYLGKEFSPRLSAGIQLDYRVSSYTAENTLIFGTNDPVNLERNSNRFGIALFSRHILNPGKTFELFLQPFAKYSIANEQEMRDDALIQEEKTNFLELGVGAGILYNISDRLRANLRSGALNYVNGNWEVTDTDISKNFTSFGSSFNLSTVFIGMEIKL